MDLNWLHIEKTILSLYWLLFQDSSLVVSAPPLPLSEVLELVGVLLYKCKYDYELYILVHLKMVRDNAIALTVTMPSLVSPAELQMFLH